MLFLLLMICFILLKDSSYELSVKWIIFSFLLAVTLSNAYTKFIKKPSANTGRYTKFNTVTLVCSIAMTLVLTYAQYRKSLH
jgi:hypothetical protein